ncbi:hypothetical protein [Candidatus Nitrosocosmicus sp. SS]|jgi:hypothetical protein|uniref:hypothetical protein n=1 Tax=Candidatus Nitrosocosmicus agrestis TaxID=2563600 RepID=UPI00122E0FB2|nr:hypothetical protein [Candidatus Nitrosocosmicus sp. SS]KAA2282180.1 hypothetical protein F1Z66_07045 [Candidatus Nitrosocosmicus sp. SS]KAF0869974.1 hypothetical protein E5N71_01765 [Candidatus Nitrosocosmicus sp. SS]
MSETSDRVSNENSKKIQENTKKHSDKFELNNEYAEIIDNIGKSHETFSDSHKDEILRMAQILDQVGDTKKEKICAKVCKDLEPHGIKERYVRKILPDEYKREYNLQNGPRAELEKREQKASPIPMTTDGQIVHDDNPLDDIHEGKTFEQMKRENEITAAATTRQRAKEELQEDKEDTLENPQNLIPDNLPISSSQPILLLSDQSPEVRDMKARLDEANKIIEEQNKRITKKDQDFFNLKRSYIQSRGEAKDQEITQLKNKVTTLETQLLQIDRESIAKEGYKEVEVFKLQQGTIRMLQEVSGKSERTFFLLVHPKTMQIRAAKTDKEMHQIQAKRAAGVL